MERQIDLEIKELKELILTMGGCVEKAIEESTQALILREPKRLTTVFEQEAKINELHIKVDETCVRILAKQSPLAQDLRWIIASIRSTQIWSAWAIKPSISPTTGVATSPNLLSNP